MTILRTCDSPTAVWNHSPSHVKGSLTDFCGVDLLAVRKKCFAFFSFFFFFLSFPLVRPPAGVLRAIELLCVGERSPSALDYPDELIGPSGFLAMLGRQPLEKPCLRVLFLKLSFATPHTCIVEL